MQRFHVGTKAILFASALTLATYGCGEDSTGPGNGGRVATTSVSIVDDAFQPSAIQVSPGATVTWTWNGTETHDVEFADASIADSPSQTSGTYSVAMPTAPGTYTYQCGWHPGVMTGSVLVQ